MAYCANLDSSRTRNCEARGSLVCTNCRLVLYCSSTCQKAHWWAHKRNCKSALMDDSWKPAWVVQGRQPSFVGPGVDAKFGTPKFLWGNTPAIDIVRLANHEGETSPGPLNFLFAASGDLRSVITSLASIAPEYRGTVHLHINDHDLTVTARNVIILLIFFTFDDAALAAEHAIHVFYSAFLAKGCFDAMQSKIKPLIQGVCTKIADRSTNGVLGKTWKFGGSSIRLVLTKSAWQKLLSFFDVPAGTTKETAQKARNTVVNAPGRIDYVHRHLLKQEPAHRVSIMQFREDGLLLPLGTARAEFQIPNPTFFQTPGEWPMTDDADPRAGWCYKQVQTGYHGLAVNDIYGMLHHHLTELFIRFHGKLHNTPISIVLTKADAREIAPYIGGMKFARIDSPAENPHATLIMGFMNAAKEAYVLSGGEENKSLWGQDIERLKMYLPPPSVMSPGDVGKYIFNLTAARELVWDFERFFNLYLAKFDLGQLAAETGLEMKENNTIVKPWPMRLSTGPVTVEKRKEFRALLASHHTGMERYVEWQVKRDGVTEDLD
ncbi:hypothetical protein QBC47DRAFT_424948 [Echria macrotheca]|uniref:MYND-type domain-containing protein n=1 Tax=Echria macrotheca TaxID=438768 RepID=A0AAJ0B5G5_9PEZI|nr:hypothetical protein QBC47DRAFT_424948 [Echria macrotheca]